jgi:putative ABC transport system permease protein
MNTASLLLANFRRKRIRTILTICSFAIALFLFGLLAVIHASFYRGVEIAGVDRLIVRNRISLIMPLPYSYNERLKQIKGVSMVTYAFWFGGVYQTERNFFPQYAIDTNTYAGMFPEFSIPPDQWKAFVEDRQGCVVGRKLAERFNWKVGDRIPLKGTIFPGAWEFNLRGIFDGKTSSADTSQFWLQYKYIEETSTYIKGRVGWYYVRIENPDRSAEISKAIDNEFSNSSYETVTETERAFTAAFVKQFGNIKLIILVIGGVVFFTLLLITGSNMAMSIRERTADIGIMKTLGFSGIRILFMVLAESLLIALAGGGIGLGLAKLFTMRGDPTGGLLTFFDLDAKTIGLGFISVILIGLAAGIIPAVQSMRLKIVDALRRV